MPRTGMQQLQAVSIRHDQVHRDDIRLPARENGTKRDGIVDHLDREAQPFGIHSQFLSEAPVVIDDQKSRAVFSHCCPRVISPAAR